MAEREPLMSIGQIAGRLNVSRSTVRRLIACHELRGVRIGHQWRARAEDVERLATPAEEHVARSLGVSTSTQYVPVGIAVQRPSWETAGTKKATSARN